MSGGGWRVRQRKKMYVKGMKTYYLFVKFIRHMSEVAQSCPSLCDLMYYTVHEILLGRVLKRVAVPFSRVSSQPRDQTQVSLIAGRFFTS